MGYCEGGLGEEVGVVGVDFVVSVFVEGELWRSWFSSSRIWQEINQSRYARGDRGDSSKNDERDDPGYGKPLFLRVCRLDRTTER